jgi:predicted glycosyltransferase involved in capsule biosynthesis
MSDIKLSVIVPFRSEKSMPHLGLRLKQILNHFILKQNIEYIVVDSGSSQKDADYNRYICLEKNIKYIYQDTRKKTFSIGGARDYGAQYASGDCVTFLDIDLRFSSNFFEKIIHLIEVYGVHREKRPFFVIPCLYLTQEGTQLYELSSSDEQLTRLYIEWMHGSNENIQNMAPCSSVMVVNRHHYLSVGGHNDAFYGHGYEDFDLYHRLMQEDGKIPRADNYYLDTKSFSTGTYNGFRSQLRLLGSVALYHGLYVVHLWHPRPQSCSFYSKMYKNREIWKDYFLDYDKNCFHPDPLPDLSKTKQTSAFFGEPRTNASRCLKDIFPFLGNIVYVLEYNFIYKNGKLRESEFKLFLKKYNISRIVFTNPYGNEARLCIYKWCRENNFPFLCFERGALLDSWFIDQNGFNADSYSYAPCMWDEPLSPEQEEDISDYIVRSLQAQESLEKQGPSIGGKGLAQKLRIGGRKVLFVPLQRPSDTVIKHFMPKFKDYSDFISHIDDIALFLKRKGWTVLVKQHPLEISDIILKNAVVVDTETHFLDLIDLCHSIALVNSGVGVYAMMAQKPCFIFGDAFYSIDGVNVSLVGMKPNQAAKIISESYAVNTEKAKRFLYYLYKEFYSFGRSEAFTRKESDGSLRSITKKIDFYTIRIPKLINISYSMRSQDKIGLSAPLFNIYRLDIWNKMNNKKPVKNNLDNVVLAENTNKKINKLKMGKLLRSPYSFFRDSRFLFLRPLKYICWR